MPKRTFAIRALSLAAGLVMIGASSAGASSAVADPAGTDSSGPPTPGGAVFLATDMNGINAPAADPDGTGRVVVRIQGTQLCFLIQWNNILAPFVGHIHKAPVGSNGPVAVGFWSGQLPDSVRGITGCVTANPDTLAAMVADPAAYYANVHDASFPGGAIKGQLRALTRGVDFNRLLREPLVAQLDGMQEVTTAGDPDGRAVGFVRLRGQTTVRYAFAWSAIAAPTAAHIHVGGVAQAGPVVVPFFAAPTGLPATINGVSGEVEADAALVDAIRNHPSAYYVNLHTAEFPAGAIRGQLSRTDD
ncbi:MAG: hypothetical protein V7603_344 [Micromonosporaceae bacterium]